MNTTWIWLSSSGTRRHATMQAPDGRSRRRASSSCCSHHWSRHAFQVCWWRVQEARSASDDAIAHRQDLEYGHCRWQGADNDAQPRMQRLRPSATGRSTAASSPRSARSSATPSRPSSSTATRRSTSRRRRSTPATRRRWRSGTPTRTAPTARTTSSTWPSRARAASCEARGSEGGRGVRVRDTAGGGKRIVYSHYSQFRGRLSEYMYSCIIRVFRS